MKIYIHILVLVLTCFSTQAQKSGERALPLMPIDQERVKAIASMLPKQPKGFGDPIQQRTTWARLYSTGQFDKLIRDADSLAALPFPVLTEDIYFSYYKGVDSETSKRFIMNRRRWLSKLVWAECLTNQGKYMPAINKALNDILYTTSWSFPAEDKNKTNYEGSLYTIALSSAAYGHELGETLYLLDTRLDKALKKQLLDALSRKIFKPVLDAVRYKDARSQFTSLTNTGNYNAFTLANVTIAALAVIEDRQQRALFAYIAERYSNNYLHGILDDGYCSEGMDYYAFGFGHYLLLREGLWQATKGKIDILKREKVAKAAEFVPRMEIINGLYPAIADCAQYPKPHPLVMNYLKRSLNLAFKGYDTVSYNDIDQFSLAYVMYFFPNSLSRTRKAGRLSAYQLRQYFDKAGVLVLRPGVSSKPGLGVALKGG
uniref:hypothetical protein n=1 Tax=Arcticibacter sp. TaxID=1872630 RepID=UPI00388FC29E